MFRRPSATKHLMTKVSTVYLLLTDGGDINSTLDPGHTVPAVLLQPL